ncbi:MAG: PKD domain-containing protein [Verrucomicrobiota bacterium]
MIQLRPPLAVALALGCFALAAPTVLAQTPVVSLSVPQPNASKSGPVNGVIKFHRTGDPSQSFVVNWTLGGTAVNGVDYQELPTSSPFPAGVLEGDLQIQPIPESAGRGTRTVVLTLLPGEGYTVGSPNSATVTIADESPPPPPPPSDQPVVSLSVPGPGASETGRVPGTVRFHRTGDPWKSFVVNWTFSGAAGNGVDYEQLPASAPFPAGFLQAELLIVPIDDTLAEGNETVTVTLAPGAEYTIGSPQSGTVTIADNDSPTTPPPSQPQPVTADFTAFPTSGPAPLGVQFEDKSTGPVTAWNWNFGDGATATARSPYHTYQSAGTFTATLTVTGSSGQRNSASRTITVTAPPQPQPVTAAFTAFPTSGRAPLGVQFDDQSTGPVNTWNWNFGDGTSATVRNPYHTYQSAGTFTATLTVTSGQRSSVSRAITVAAPPPPLVADFTASSLLGVAPLPVTFTDQSTGNPTSWTWSFGDGGTSTLRNPAHTYVLPGSYTARLTVRNTAGQTSSKSRVITVNAPLPSPLPLPGL